MSEEEIKNIVRRLRYIKIGYEDNGYMSVLAFDAIKKASEIIENQQNEIEKLKNHNKELLRKLRNRVKEVKKLEKYSLYKKEFSTLNKQIENLKEIEEEHKKEIGELYVKLDDKETELQILKDDIKADEILYRSDLIETYIPKSTIEEKIKQFEELSLEIRKLDFKDNITIPHDLTRNDYAVKMLKELL